MRPGQQNKRMRGRNNNRKGPNPLTRSYESSGPDVKIRGTAHHIGEKYLQLARDAQSSGDPVMAESYLQHAEHYFRLIAAAQQAQQQAQFGYQRQPGEAEMDEGDEDDGFEGIPDRFASPLERLAPPPQAYAPQPSYNGQPGFQERQPYMNGDRQPSERQDRMERPERFERQDRQDRMERQDRPPRQERPYQERHSQGRDQEGRGQRGNRPPRDYRNDSQPRYEPRNDMRPSEEIEGQSLPAFITAPMRIPTDVQMAEGELNGMGMEVMDTPEMEAETAGFHLRPRRRRRTTKPSSETANPGNEATNATDPVGD